MQNNNGGYQTTRFKIKVICFIVGIFGLIIFAGIVGIVSFMVGRNQAIQEESDKQIDEEQTEEMVCNDWVNNFQDDYQNNMLVFYDRNCKKITINYDDSVPISFDYGYSQENISWKFIPFVKEKTLYVYDLEEEGEFEVHRITSNIEVPEVN